MNNLQIYYSPKKYFKISWFKIYLFCPLFLIFSCSDQTLNKELENFNYTNTQTELRNQLCDLAIPCTPEENVKTKSYMINGCKVTVTFTLVKCDPSIYAYIGVKDFSFSFAESAPCRNIKQAWNQYYFVGQTLQANLALNDFYRTLTLLVQADVMSDLDPAPYLKYNSIMNFDWVETKCHTICAKEIVFDDLPSYFDLSYAECGYKCCRRETTYKYIENSEGGGSWVQQGDPIVKEVYPTIPCEYKPVECIEGASQWDPNCHPACERL